MCVEIAQNSQEWCTEFASYVRRIFNYLAQNSDNPIFNHCDILIQLNVERHSTLTEQYEYRWLWPGQFVQNCCYDVQSFCCVRTVFGCWTLVSGLNPLNCAQRWCLHWLSWRDAVHYHLRSGTAVWTAVCE